LIWFLDQLKINNTLKFCNSLFVSGSKITSSQSFLDNFCKEYVAKPKQTYYLLKTIDYNLEYKIIPIDVYQFLISSFDEDFRDGVKFTRIAEILQCDDQLCRASTNLRIPAVSRQARIHNMKIALLELQKAGVVVTKEDIPESALVEGDVLITMKLLWNIFIFAELPRIRAETIFEEIREINGGIKRFRDNNRAARYNCGIIANLLEWCSSICSRYDIEVRDFDGLVFTDGRIYGCLIHYYCPQLLDIKQLLANGDFYRQFMNSQNEEEAKKYRKKNEDIIFKAIQEIQFVPWVISPIQVTDKVIITFVAYLCDRLLTLKKGNDTSMLLTSLTQKISLLTTLTPDDE